MRKISLFAVSILLKTALLFSQSPESSTYYKRKLSLQEASITSSYYQQNGNNSAVTGGIGTEELTDISNNFSISFRLNSKSKRIHEFGLSQGVDFYTSASSDKIDTVQSSPSRLDVRVYPQLSWSTSNPSETLGVSSNISFSTEYDYRSFGLGAGVWLQSEDKNRLFSADGQVFLDSWKYILPQELRPIGYGSGAQDDPLPIERRARNSYNLSLVYKQVINKRLQVGLNLNPSYQNGLLSTPFHRVFNLQFEPMLEELPDERWKLPVAMRLHYFLGERVVCRFHYRHYRDSWGLTGNTLNVEVPVWIRPNFSVAPFLRLHQQSAVQYFAPFASHEGDPEFRTSDNDLAELNSIFYGGQVRYVRPEGLLGIPNFNRIELRGGVYNQSRGLNAFIFTLNLAYQLPK